MKGRLDTPHSIRNPFWKRFSDPENVTLGLPNGGYVITLNDEFRLGLFDSFG